MVLMDCKQEQFCHCSSPNLEDEGANDPDPVRYHVVGRNNDLRPPFKVVIDVLITALETVAEEDSGFLNQKFVLAWYRRISLYLVNIQNQKIKVGVFGGLFAISLLHVGLR